MVQVRDDEGSDGVETGGDIWTQVKFWKQSCKKGFARCGSINVESKEEKTIVLGLSNREHGGIIN